MAAGRQGERLIAAGRKHPRSRCVIVGQNRLLVECLCLLLQAQLEICSLLPSSKAALARVRQFNPDFVIIEGSPPSDEILSFVSQLRQERPGLAITVLSDGCTGGSLQTSSVERFCSATELLERVRTWMEPVSAMSGNTATHKNSQQELGFNLSYRELEVLVLLVRGFRMKEVARRLGISPRTVAFHKYRAMESNGLRTQADLLKFALDHGLLSGSSAGPRTHLRSAPLWREGYTSHTRPRGRFDDG